MLAFNASTKEIQAGKTPSCERVYLPPVKNPSVCSTWNQEKKTILGISWKIPLLSPFLFITAGILLPQSFSVLLTQENIDHKLILAPPHPFHSSVISPGGNVSFGIISSPERGAGMQYVYSSSHTSSNPGQCAIKGNYLESQNPQNNTCRGCHLLDLNLFLSPRSIKTPWQKSVPDICYSGPRTPVLEKEARTGLEVSFKMGIEWQLVEIFLSASPWIFLHDVICTKISFHWNNTDAI